MLHSQNCRRRLPAGGTLFQVGELPSMVYQVVRGFVKLVSRQDNGRELVVDVIFPGELLNAPDGPYEFSAVAGCQHDLELLAMPLEVNAWHP